MALWKTSNPALSEKTFDRFSGSGSGTAIDAAERMSLQGTVNKTGILLILCMATAAWTWVQFLQSEDAAPPYGLMMLGLAGGFVFALVTAFKMTWAPVTAPIYALCEGFVLGGISAMLNARYPGIAIEAVSLTFGTLLALLILYSSRVIKVTEKFRLGIFAATGGIALFYLLEMILGFFGIRFVAVNGSGLIGIGFSLFVVAIASLNLILDFDFIERGVNAGAPKYMEWYGGFGIMVTLVWLYLEILRLLAKTSSRR
jgi:uncharacterized YccA/Bax inhibitor family protein